MQLRFLGAFQEVGRSAIAVKTANSQILMDYGVMINHEVSFPVHVSPKDLDAVVLTHAPRSQRTRTIVLRTFQASIVRYRTDLQTNESFGSRHDQTEWILSAVRIHRFREHVRSRHISGLPITNQDRGRDGYHGECRTYTRKRSSNR